MNMFIILFIYSYTYMYSRGKVTSIMNVRCLGDIYKIFCLIVVFNQLLHIYKRMHVHISIICIVFLFKIMIYIHNHILMSNKIYCIPTKLCCVIPVVFCVFGITFLFVFFACYIFTNMLI